MPLPYDDGAFQEAMLSTFPLVSYTVNVAPQRQKGRETSTRHRYSIRSRTPREHENAIRCFCNDDKRLARQHVAGCRARGAT